MRSVIAGTKDRRRWIMRWKACTAYFTSPRIIGSGPQPREIHESM